LSTTNDNLTEDGNVTKMMFDYYAIHIYDDDSISEIIRSFQKRKRNNTPIIISTKSRNDAILSYLIYFVESAREYFHKLVEVIDCSFKP